MRHKCVQLSALWTLWRTGQVQEELTGNWYHKNRKVKTKRQLFPQVILWNVCHRNWMKVSLMVVFRSNQLLRIKGKVLELTEQRNQIRSTVLHSWLHDDQQPRRLYSSGSSREVEQKVEKNASRFPEFAKLLLVNQPLSWNERWSRLKAPIQQSWQDYRRNVRYSGRLVEHPFKHQRKKVFMYKRTNVWWEGRWRLSFSNPFKPFLAYIVLVCFFRTIWSSFIAYGKKFFKKRWFREKLHALVDLFIDLIFILVILKFPGKFYVRGNRLWSKTMLMN